MPTPTSVLILSDIHANIEALDAVLSHAAPFDSVWFLGDIVGYGPDPEACVARLREIEPACWLAGNHDWAAIGKMDVDEFNPEARRAALWTGDQLSEESRKWLGSVEPRLDLDAPTMTLVHASPRQPVWEYILDASVAMDCFAHFQSPACIFGHTHVPAAYEEGLDGALRHSLRDGVPLDLGTGRWLLNPGSVGQPRDGDPRASWATYEPERRRITFHRVAYDIAAVQAKILAAGLPPRLAARLDYGW